MATMTITVSHNVLNICCWLHESFITIDLYRKPYLQLNLESLNLYVKFLVVFLGLPLPLLIYIINSNWFLFYVHLQVSLTYAKMIFNFFLILLFIYITTYYSRKTIFFFFCIITDTFIPIFLYDDIKFVYMLLINSLILKSIKHRWFDNCLIKFLFQ